MKYGLYSMRDVKGSFSSPTADYNDSSALRNFAFAVNNSSSVMNFAPKDFQLYKVAVFDSENCSIEPVYPIELIADGSSVYGGNYEK